jgi:hypothetical protein
MGQNKITKGKKNYIKVKLEIVTGVKNFLTINEQNNITGGKNNYIKVKLEIVTGVKNFLTINGVK